MVAEAAGRNQGDRGSDLASHQHIFPADMDVRDRDGGEWSLVVGMWLLFKQRLRRSLFHHAASVHDWDVVRDMPAPNPVPLQASRPCRPFHDPIFGASPDLRGYTHWGFTFLYRSKWSLNQSLCSSSSGIFA